MNLNQYGQYIPSVQTDETGTRVGGLTIANLGDLVDVAFRVHQKYAWKKLSPATRWWRNAKFGMATVGIDVLMSAALAPPRHMVSQGIAGTAGGIAAWGGFALGSEIGAAVGTALIPIPGVGTAVGAIVGGFLGGYYADQAVRNPTAKAAQSFVEYDRNRRRLGMGGDYVDTQAAVTMRQRAAQELGSSLLNARRYLGREGLLMHE